jgi:hypothetical protein
MIKYINTENPLFDLQDIINNWSIRQEVLMVVPTSFGSREEALKLRKENRCLGLTAAGGLSVVAKNNKYYSNLPASIDYQFWVAACEGEIQQSVSSAYPYAELLYVPEEFFNDFKNCSNSEVYLLDIVKANNERHKKSTICFLGFGEGYGHRSYSENEMEEITNYLIEFFDQQETGILDKIASEIF